MANPGKSGLQVDLTDLTFFDAAGKALLAAMQAHGAEFVAEDCLTKAVVAEITKTPSSKSTGNQP
jgi:anti-anti-sigma regulatory factor